MSPYQFRFISTVVIFVLGATLIASLVFAATIPTRISNAQLEVACASARANIQQLEALHSIAVALGLPRDTVVVPKLPQECL